MKSFLFALVTLLFTFSAAAQTAPSSTGTPMGNPAPAAAQDPNAQKARALLEQCIQAMGGQAWLNVEDMEQQGRSYSYFHGQPNSLGTLFWRFWKYPNKDRVELTKQRDVVYLNVGDKGYEITYKGTAAQEPEALADYNRRRTHSLEIVLRQWLKQPGTALFYDGPAIAEQRQTDSVTVMNAENDSVTLFLDQNSHLPIKKTFEWRDPRDRLKNVEGEIFDNWRAEQGIMTPHSILRTHNGDTTNQRFITSVRYNIPMPDSLFQTSITYDPNRSPTKHR